MKKEMLFKIGLVNKSTVQTIKDTTTFYTSDTELWLGFELLETELIFDSAEILLLNKDDRSFIVRSVKQEQGKYWYELESDIIAHHGEWLGQLQFNKDEEAFTSKKFGFRIENDLSNDRPPKLNEVNTWKNLREIADKLIIDLQIEQDETLGFLENRQDTVESKFDLLQQEMADKDVISAPEIFDARNGEANLKTRLDKEQQEINAQLAETIDLSGDAFSKNWAINVRQATPSPAYMTIIDDDARKEVWTKLKPLADELGIPITVAAVVRNEQTTPDQDLTIEQLLELQNNGWEIASHSVTHRNLRDLTEEELEYEMWHSREYFRNRGLDIKNFVAPFGSNDSREVRRASAKYYDCTPYASGGVNALPLSNHRLFRVPMGSYTPNGENTLEFYKSKVDEAISKGGWVIFMTHVWHEDHNATQQQYLRETIEYAKSLSVEICNLRDGFAKMGNILEVEDRLTVDFNGGINPNYTNIAITKQHEVTKDTAPIYFYQKYHNKIVHSRLDKPSGSNYLWDGILTTFAIGTTSIFYQKYTPHRSTKQLIRYALNKDEWSDFEEPHPLVVSKGSPTYTDTTPISTYPKNKITYSKIATADGAGFPKAAGLLITNRIASENGYDFQEFHSYHVGNKYYRGTNNAGEWLSWKQITMA